MVSLTPGIVFTLYPVYRPGAYSRCRYMGDWAARVVGQPQFGGSKPRVEGANGAGVAGERGGAIPRAFVAAGAVGQRRRRVLERREVDCRRDDFQLRRRLRKTRVGDRREDAVTNLLVALPDVGLLLPEQLVQLLHVLVDRIGEIGELDRQDVAVREPDYRVPSPRERPAVDEVGIEETREEIEVVVNRVVDAVLVRFTEPRFSDAMPACWRNGE